uniref:Uncharacterized protein n=1 Tax=Romanomermis culicivorax TaxID=13658 RepID=A0A915JBD2_ROMCU
MLRFIGSTAKVTKKSPTTKVHPKTSPPKKSPPKKPSPKIAPKATSNFKILSVAKASTLEDDAFEPDYMPPWDDEIPITTVDIPGVSNKNDCQTNYINNNDPLMNDDYVLQPLDNPIPLLIEIRNLLSTYLSDIKQLLIDNKDELKKTVRLLEIRRKDKTLDGSQNITWAKPLTTVEEVLNDIQWTSSKYNEIRKLTTDLTIALAVRCFYGADVLQYSSVKRDDPQKQIGRLDNRKLRQIKDIVRTECRTKEKYIEGDFEMHWAAAETALQKKCYSLRGEQIRQATHSQLAKMAADGERTT